MISSDDDFVEAVKTILPESGYVFCPGILVVAYRDFFEVLHYHSKEVHIAAVIEAQRQVTEDLQAELEETVARNWSRSLMSCTVKRSS